MGQAIEWVRANPWVTFAIVVYVVVSVAPRPHPDKHKGVWMWLWLIADRLSMLTSDKMPGALKWILAGSPLPSKPDGDKPES